MARYVLRLPESLAEKIEKAAEQEDKLPTEWVRDLLREAFEDESADRDTEGEPNG